MELKWKAIYLDGKSLNQYNEDKSVNKYTDIDRTILKFFELYKENKLILRVHLDDNKRLIFRRRVSLKMGVGITEVVYLVGWQKTVERKNVQSICYIFEDGHIEMAGAWNEKSDFAYAPNLIEEEKDGSESK
ncbi:hypothetical protein LCGC14_1857460 [marine sediment metagenome]|uniref:Uncharacterized protein n=1 Tax=marine sediment metagenome TaxID=412755 RepID=A0A0F9G8F4_9ZZZZ